MPPKNLGADPATDHAPFIDQRNVCYVNIPRGQARPLNVPSATILQFPSSHAPVRPQAVAERPSNIFPTQPELSHSGEIQPVPERVSWHGSPETLPLPSLYVRNFRRDVAYPGSPLTGDQRKAEWKALLDATFFIWVKRGWRNATLRFVSFNPGLDPASTRDLGETLQSRIGDIQRRSGLPRRDWIMCWEPKPTLNGHLLVAVNDEAAERLSHLPESWTFRRFDRNGGDTCLDVRKLYSRDLKWYRAYCSMLWWQGANFDGSPVRLSKHLREDMERAGFTVPLRRYAKRVKAASAIIHAEETAAIDAQQIWRDDWRDAA